MAGIGAATFAITCNGTTHIIQLPNALHVPDLDCLGLITWHGLHRKGCTHCVGDGEVLITFPKFSLSKVIGLDGDPCFDVAPVSSPDLTPCDFNGKATHDPFGLV